MPFDQRAFDIRCEWGRPGIDTLIDFTDVFVIVDVFHSARLWTSPSLAALKSSHRRDRRFEV
jgi:hypothetical protein